MKQPKFISYIKERIIAETTPEQFIRYITTGFLSFATEVSLLYILKDLCGIWYIYANSIAVFIIFWLNFLMNRFWTFKSRTKFTRQLFLYGILFVINLVASNLIMYLLTDLLKIYYLISKIFAVGLVVSWNFILYKKIIYI